MGKRRSKGGIFGGTFLAELERVVAEGKFIELVDEVAEGEEVIGKMSNLEKAIYTLADRMSKEVKATCERCGDTAEDRKSAKCAHIFQLKEEIKALAQLRWALIRERFNLPDSSIGIRKDFKIVKMPDKEERDIRVIGIGDLGSLFIG